MTFELEVPQNIRTLIPYPPGKPIAETEREFGITGVVKLASNENPLGPSPKAVVAIQKMIGTSNLYPDGSHFELKQALIKVHGCTAAELTVGCGSNEIIDLLLRVFVARERNVVSHEAAFVAYKLCAQLQGCEFREAAINPTDLSISVDALLAKVDSNTRLVFVANPNNPTGGLIAKSEIERLATELLRRKVLLVLDYAYYEYVEPALVEAPEHLARRFENVVILRTFSKVYGLGGLRVGYALARPEVIAMLERARQPFNVTSVGLAAAAAALEDHDHVCRSVDLNREQKKRLESELKKRGYKVFESHGNFLLFDLKRDTKALHTEFLRRGVIVRPVANYGFPTYLRISIGLEHENTKFLAALDEVQKLK